MAIKTQGTHVFMLHEGEFLKIACPTGIDMGGAPADQIDVTCLGSDTREYIAGLKSPGAVTFEINLNPGNKSHKVLFDLSEADDNPVKSFAIGWSDGKSEPTASGENATYPADRTWSVFKGYISDFPINFAANSAVKGNISIQTSGKRQWIEKDEGGEASATASATAEATAEPTGGISE